MADTTTATAGISSNQAPVDPSMQLTHAEVERSLAIKQAVEARPDLRNLTDFMYVQYAFASDPDETIESVLHRVYGMQCFYEEYKIRHGDAMQATEFFHQLTLLQPGLHVTVEPLNSTKNYMFMTDVSAYRPSLIKTPQDMQNFMAGWHTLYQCMFPDFSSIRSGYTQMCECMDASLVNFDSVITDKMIHELYIPYPKTHREDFFLNSPTVVNMLWAMWKPYLPDRIRTALHLGHKVAGFEGRKVDVLYKIPTAEAARQKMIVRVLALLELRFRNEATFSLERVSIKTD